MPGSVLVDVAIDQGGCFETSKPTTHTEPTYVVDGVIHYCVANMPGAVARTSTMALAGATLPQGLAIANKGFEQAVKEDATLALGVNVYQGQAHHPVGGPSPRARLHAAGQSAQGLGPARYPIGYSAAAGHEPAGRAGLQEPRSDAVSNAAPPWGAWWMPYWGRLPGLVPRRRRTGELPRTRSAKELGWATCSASTSPPVPASEETVRPELMQGAHRRQGDRHALSVAEVGPRSNR